LPHENGWMFEIFGTLRANKRKDLFLTANRDLYSRYKNPIISYEHTGIIKGKWHPAMESLFTKNNINIDFSIRGIYYKKNILLRKIETINKLLKNPISIIISLISK
jgi:hypothetical protein